MEIGFVSSTTNDDTPMVRWFNQDMAYGPFHAISFVPDEHDINLMPADGMQGAASTPGYIEFEMLDIDQTRRSLRTTRSQER